MMETSYERVNYGLRPAKYIERRMFVETVKRLWPFTVPDRYRYVGLGSIYFSDFIVFHQQIGMEDLTSIEYDVNQAQRDRFSFNRPYSCVKMKFGSTNDVLPTLEWESRTVLWLDYDDPLEDTHLADIATFAAEAASGSLIIMSVNCHTRRQGAPALLSGLKSRLSDVNIPSDLTAEALRGEGMGDVHRTIFIEQLNHVLNRRNGPLRVERRLIFRQLFNFRYSDGAMMQTVGGILVEARDIEKLDSCRFDELPFVRSDEETYHIQPPNLTYRELRHIGIQLPCNDPNAINSPGLSDDAKRQYSELYRYYPTFAVTEM